MSDASKIDDGGAAFPHMAPTGFYTTRDLGHGTFTAEPQLAPVPGLTKRDYFAAAFMAAMLGRADATADNKEGLSVLFASVATMSLDAADALIAASKTGGHEHD